MDLRSAIGRGILVKGEFDPAVWTVLEPHLSEGDVFIDAGCNIGYYSVLASRKVGRTGEVHAFDVDPRPLKVLVKTLERTGLTNVVVHPYALGAFVTVSCIETKMESGHTTLSEGRGGRKYPILKMDAWSDYFQGKRLAAIKIDVEGHDQEVLRGATDILTRHRPVVVCEGNAMEGGADHDAARKEITTLLRELGYTGQPVEGALSGDMVFLPAQEASRSRQ